MNNSWVGCRDFDNQIDAILSYCGPSFDGNDTDAEDEFRPKGMRPDRAGYCYALVNESIPGMVKIGMTKKHPSIRAKQLSQQTASPTPFKIAYFQRYFDNQKAERFLHASLSECRVSNKEFFRVDISELPKLFHWAACNKEG